MNARTSWTTAFSGLGSRRLKALSIGLISLSLITLVGWIIQSTHPLSTLSTVHRTPLNISSDFQVVEHGSGFVYSAYIDDRPARDFNSKAANSVVRVFVYFLRTIDVRHKWKCLLWSDDKDTPPTVATISTVTDLNTFTSQGLLVAMVICDMPANLSRLVVRGVSLESFESDRMNLVDVVDLRQTTTSNPLNRLSTKPPNVTFTVCTSPIHGNYYTTRDIVNFIEVSRILGAERFVFYLDKNVDLSLRSCLESYRERGIVEMYPFTPPLLDGLHYHGQILSVTDCVYRTMYRTKYLINQDIDEVIVPLNANDWPSMLSAIHKSIGTKEAERIASYSFQNQFFPLEAPDDATMNESFLVRRYNIKTLLKTQKDSYVFPHKDRSKVMARPERILIWHVHLILTENLIQPTDTIYYVSKDDAVLHHYRSSQTKKGLTRDRRMHRNASLITERIHFGMGFCSEIDSNR